MDVEEIYHAVRRAAARMDSPESVTIDILIEVGVLDLPTWYDNRYSHISVAALHERRLIDPECPECSGRGGDYEPHEAHDRQWCYEPHEAHDRQWCWCRTCAYPAIAAIKDRANRIKESLKAGVRPPGLTLPEKLPCSPKPDATSPRN